MCIRDREEIKRIEKLTFGEDQQYLKTIQQFFLICLWCGFRFSTAISLLPSDIKQTKEGLIVEKLKIAKTNKRLFLPLYLLGVKNENGLTKSEQLVKDLLEQRSLEAGGQLVEFKALPFFGFTLQYYNRALKVLAKLAGIKKHCSSHICRRSFASLMVNEFGVPLSLVKKMMQHDDIRTCLLYTSPSPRDATLSRMPSSA